MSDTPWTPGPWERLKHGGFKSSGSVFAPNRVVHSSCWIDGSWCASDATPESIANDNLIAAAPELAEALEKLLVWFDGDRASWILEENAALLFAARAALAKARGGTT